MSWHDYHPVWHVLLPKRSNNHHARLWHPVGLLWLIALAAVMPVWVHFITVQRPDVLGYASQIRVEEIVNLTNQQRAANGLPPLVLNDALNHSAAAKADDMLRQDYWSHVSPGGTQPWFFFSQAGYNYRHAGENLARDFPDASSAMTAWMASPTHRDNILSSKYVDVGIAVVDGDLDGKDTTLIVTHFGSQPTSDVAQIPDATSETRDEATLTVLDEVVLGEQEVDGLTHQVESGEVVLVEPVPVFTPLDITKSWSIAIAGLVIGVLLLDMYIVSRKQVARMSGRPLAHMLILGTFIIAIILTRPGLIL